MKYYDINKNKEHIKYLIKWLYDEMMSAGGDGDALWYSENYNVNDICSLFIEFNSTLRFPKKIEWLDGKTFNFGDYQEWITVTNDKKIFDTRPNWQQATVVW